MGMICTLFSVPDDSARQLVADPTRIHELLGSLREEGGGVSLEKSWHGSSFRSHRQRLGRRPAAPISSPAAVIPSVLRMSGVARLVFFFPFRLSCSIRPSVASRIEDFARGFDLAEMDREGVYPQIWDEPLEDLLDEYRTYLAAAKELVRQASHDGHALLIVVN